MHDNLYKWCDKWLDAFSSSSRNTSGNFQIFRPYDVTNQYVPIRSLLWRSGTDNFDIGSNMTRKEVGNELNKVPRRNEQVVKKLRLASFL